MLALAALAGCGGGEGAAAGATVNVYLGAGLCRGAERALAAAGGEAGDLRVRAVCLPPVEGGAGGAGGEAGSGARLDLATVGANARRATQDSTAIAFAEPPGPANRFSRPIVEEAGIAYLVTASGAKAIRGVLAAVEEAGSGSLRDEVRGALEAG